MLHTVYNKMDTNIYKNIPCHNIYKNILRHLTPWHCFIYLTWWVFLVSIRMHPKYKIDSAVPSSCNKNTKAMRHSAQHTTDLYNEMIINMFQIYWRVTKLQNSYVEKN